MKNLVGKACYCDIKYKWREYYIPKIKLWYRGWGVTII